MPILRCEKCENECLWGEGFYVLSFNKNYKSSGDHKVSTNDETTTLCQDCMGMLRLWLADKYENV